MPSQASSDTGDQDARRHGAIVEGTLSDMESLAEIITRRGRFARDRKYTADMRERGLEIFDQAIKHEVPPALLGAGPVCAVLKSVMGAVGDLCLENQKQLATSASLETAIKQENEQDGGEGEGEMLEGRKHLLADGTQDSERPSKRIKTAAKSLAPHSNADSSASKPNASGKPDSQTESGAWEAAATAGAKDNPNTDNVAAANATPLTSPEPNPSNPSSKCSGNNGGKRSGRNGTRGRGSLRNGNDPAAGPSRAADKKIPTLAEPMKNDKVDRVAREDSPARLIVKLKVPKLFWSMQKSNDIHSTNIAPKTPSPKKQKPQPKPTECEGKGDPRGLFMRIWVPSFGSEGSVPPSPDDPYDPSMHASLHGNGTVSLRGGGGIEESRESFQNSHSAWMPCAGTEEPIPIVERKEDCDLCSDSKAPSKEASPTTVTNDSAWETVSNATRTLNLSPTNASTIFPSPLQRPYLLAFPPFPSFPLRELHPFKRGIDIALENVYEDYVSANNLDTPTKDHDFNSSNNSNSESSETKTLAAVVEHLLNNRPTFLEDRGDWERRTVLKGGTYVYEAVKAVCEDGSEFWDKKVTKENVQALCDLLRAHAEVEMKLKATEKT